MADYAVIREQIKLLVDPKFLAMREELFGSGISFGRITDSKLPTGTVVVGGPGGTTDPGDLGFITGISVYSGGTLIGSDKKELSFLGPALSTAGNRVTVDFTGVLGQKITNPMTTAGDIIYGTTGGTPVRRSIGSNGQYLAVVAGIPQWVSLASGTGGALADPTTTDGDLIYRNTGGITRLPIGTSGQVLQVSGGEPIWADAPTTGMTNPMTTIGDLIRGGTSGSPTRVAIGTEGYRLAVSGGIPQWTPLPPDVGFANPMISDGDMIYRYAGAVTRLPIDAEGDVLTVSGGYPRWKAFNALVNPMVSGGDIIYGKYASSFTDEAPAGTATQSSTNGSNTADLAIDVNDSTFASMNGGNSTQWLKVDLGSAKTIARFRLLQSSGGFVRADAYKIQSSDDGSTWVDRYSITSGAPNDSGQIAFTTPITAQYWRAWTPSSGAFAWEICTLSLYSGTNAGTPERLGIGSPGQVLTVSSGNYPVWLTPSGGGVSVSGFTNPMTTLGDIIYAQTSGSATRLGIGSTGQVLTVAGGVPVWSTPTASSGGGSVTISGASFTQVIGDSSSTVYPVTHNLGTRDLLVQVRQNSPPYEYVYPNIYASGTNTSVVSFNSAPATSGYRVLIGVNGSSTSSTLHAPVDSDFSWVNQGGASIDAVNNALYLLAPANSSQSIRIRAKTAPTAPYKVDILWRPLIYPTNNGLCTLGWRNSSNGKLVGIRYGYANGWQLAIIYSDSATSDNSATAVETFGRIAPLYIRLEDDNTNRKIWFSEDGTHYLLYYSESRTTFTTPDQLFFAADSRTSSHDVGLTIESWYEH